MSRGAKRIKFSERVVDDKPEALKPQTLNPEPRTASCLGFRALGLGIRGPHTLKRSKQVLCSYLESCGPQPLVS